MNAVVVTGAHGRVGRVLVESLRAAGRAVIPIDVRRPSGALETLQLDLNDPVLLRDAFAGASVVVHLAAHMSWDPRESSEVVKTNVMSAYNVLESAAAAGVRRVVMGSTGEVYPENAPVYLPVDEAHPCRPTTAYGLSKYLSEQIVDFFSRTSRLEVVTLRFSHTQNASELADETSTMSGPRFFLAAKAVQQRAFGNEDFAEKLESLDDGKGRMYIATDAAGTPFRMGICETRDLVQGIELAMSAEGVAGETIGIGAPRAASFDEIVLPLARALNRDVCEVVMPGNPVNYETSNRKAEELLGYTPTWTIERMIEAAVAAIQ